jgi:2-amino-4-hydroxy-6-hydroxymethyldihydropteridine diphosphokinase
LPSAPTSATARRRSRRPWPLWPPSPRRGSSAVSSLYESPSEGAEGPPYLNAVATVETGLTPEALLEALLTIETAHGRERSTPNAPRTLDLDLLLHADAVVATKRLVLPHPRLHERAFVLEPLAEIAPGLVVPGRGPVEALRLAARSQPIRRVGPAPEIARASAPDTRLARFRHIAIEGPIGAGKTTLARRLAARLDADLVLEQPAENPFLERFYADMPGYAMQAQMAFLFQRQKQLAPWAQTSVFAAQGRSVVSDWMLAKDPIFARLTLSDDEHRLYAQLYAPIAATLPTPDLVVWLRASPETLLARVRRRGVAMERTIDRGYLERLSDAYADHFESSDAQPVLAVEADRFDLAVDVERLVDRLATFALSGSRTDRRGVFEGSASRAA